MKTPTPPKNGPGTPAEIGPLNVLDSRPEERFDRLTRIARRLFEVPIALISLIDDEGLWFKSVQGLDAKEIPGDLSFWGHAIHKDDLLIVPDTLLDERFKDKPLVVDEPRIRFYAGCPLYDPNGARLGALCLLDRKPRDMSPEDRALLRDLTTMVEHELTALQLATRDELTRLANRRGLLPLAQNALNLCKRRSLPALMLYFDLDRFKQINDRYGHAEGDRALAAFGRLLLDSFRKSDVIGRLGGDEFVALLSGARKSSRLGMVERFEQAVRTYNEEQRRGYDIRFSVDLCEFDPERHHSVLDLLNGADRHMYKPS